MLQGFKLLTLKMWQFQTNFSLLFLELKNHYKQVLNSLQYISGFQMLSPCHSWQGIVIRRSESFSRFLVIIIHSEMINELRLKTEPYITCFLFILLINELRLRTEPYIMCFLFILSWKSTLKKSLLSDGHFAIDKCWFYNSHFGFTWFILQF